MRTPKSIHQAELCNNIFVPFCLFLKKNVIFSKEGCPHTTGIGTGTFCTKTKIDSSCNFYNDFNNYPRRIYDSSALDLSYIYRTSNIILGFTINQEYIFREMHISPPFFGISFIFPKLTLRLFAFIRQLVLYNDVTMNI